MLNFIERLGPGGKALRMNELLLLGVFLLVNFAFVLPSTAQTHENKALLEAARHLKRKDYENAVKIIRNRPQESWAIIDQIAATLESFSSEAWSRPNQLNDATKLILSKVSSDELLDYWDVDNRIDTLLLLEITKRVVAAQPDADPALPIDANRGLAVITDAIATNRSRMTALSSLARLPTVKLEQKTFDAVIVCLDDETAFTSPRGCSSWSIREGAVNVLRRHVPQYEKELAGLLDDERSHRRRCGIEILAGDALVFEQHSDRIFEMLEDQDGQVRSFAVSHLTLLAKRLPEVVTYLISQKPTLGVRRSVDSVLEKCDNEDQKRLLHWLVEGSVQDSYCAHSLRKKIPSVKQADLDELLDLMLAKFDLKTAERSQLSVLSAAGSSAKHALPEMRRVLLDADQEMENKLHLARAIYEIAGDAEEVLPYFRTALETEIGPLHKAALLGIKAVGPDAAELAPLLVSQLEDPTTGQHWYLMALRAIGPRAKGVLPKLEALQAATSQTNSRGYLAKAIQSIRGERGTERLGQK